ncbi:prolyl oligopeptidase family serine peptidase [Sphingobium cupriresistens]|uniref:prolyl oligopeptidase family serine peptidase n=1 Tax=Sphingobium cupriresistens TaxID=1132417 RepID=UPI00082ADADF|nr:prolyl oligopeptidase family serine peptidase [Sphingobium cupriresistens]
MKKRILLLVTAALLTGAGAPPSPVSAPAPADDPFLWLEDWTGPRAMQWVEAENKATVATLQGDPRYAGYFKDALAIASAKDRIAMPMLIHGRVYNVWRDTDHPQGIWRYTSEADYATDAPRWTTVLDLDALSKADGKKWVWKGASILDPDERLALIHLSDGGEDAVTLREFDLVTGQFVEGGFAIPTSKQNEDWLDKDTILLARDWGADAQGGSMTASGYPFVVKTLKRGQPLSSAQEIYRGAPSDQVGTFPMVLSDGAGNRAAFLYRGITFFGNETYLVTADGVKKLPLPAKSQLQGMVQGQVLIQTSQDWASGGVSVPTGSLAAVPLKALQSGETLKPQILFAPNARQSIDGVTATKDRVILAINDNVRGRVQVLTPGKDRWTTTPVALPDNATISIATATHKSDKAYLSVAGFLAPTTLWAIDAANPAAPRQVKAMPARFDAAGLAVDQFEATSTDGTKIPYFIVHRKDMKPDGSTPTIMTAYGGFEVPMTPSYAAITGKLWLERGNSFVLANIRGGGEFGPAWHEAGLKTKRQIIYDDFAAVAQDIFARKLSSPRKFGIYGGSNGGLLMGVAFNQHPDLWNAVTIQVPLLDMVRYEQIAAGASWVDEYGSVAVPEEKAFLEKISPYANIRRELKYPMPYIWTTTKDDRVGPQHARKFAARLKDYGLPYYFYEDTAGGHSGDADIAQGARLQAMQLVYFSRQLEGADR